MKRKIETQELSLLQTQPEYDERGQKAPVHVARWLTRSKRLSMTVCGLSTEFYRLLIPYFGWLTKDPRLCRDCLTWVENEVVEKIGS